MKCKALLGALALFMLGACSAAYTGLDGDTMHTNTLPDVAVTPLNGMRPLYSGSMNVDMEAMDSHMIGLSASLDYAIYGDAEPGPVKRYGHVIFAELSDRTGYMFSPESFARDKDFNMRGVVLDGRSWVEHQLFYDENEKDWFARAMILNNRPAPKVWIGKRWTRTEHSALRIVVEYREPLPECAGIQEKTAFVIFNETVIDVATPACKKEVEAVFARADQAFKIQRSRRQNLGYNPPANILTELPSRSRFNANLLIGPAKLHDSRQDSDD